MHREQAEPPAARHDDPLHGAGALGGKDQPHHRPPPGTAQRERRYEGRCAGYCWPRHDCLLGPGRVGVGLYVLAVCPGRPHAASTRKRAAAAGAAEARHPPVTAGAGSVRRR
ncbi:hypothetical protein GCM10023082_03740 [Streptomyces tremellae]|uniref:Uncharacterized protein n=1 Tax=Streptomyces tremellae TaxID=1124239 RepID=A0ABP7DTN9_9ACTN